MADWRLIFSNHLPDYNTYVYFKVDGKMRDELAIYLRTPVLRTLLGFLIILSF